MYDIFNVANANYNTGGRKMSECNTCPSGDSCSKDQSQCMVENNPRNNVKKIIGVMSGKGGVGKSTIAVQITKQLNNMGYKVGILDADITGPSVPRLLGLHEKRAVSGEEEMLLPIESEDGIKSMSLNYLIDEEDKPVIWRGPAVSGVVKQFWNEVLWGDLDYLVVDLPPGTSDVALTVMQSMPISGIVMVTLPQDMVSMIVTKAVHMVNTMSVPIIGVIENMGYVKCPDCGKKIDLFGKDNIDKLLFSLSLELLGELPMLTDLSEMNELFAPIVKKIIAAV